MQSFDFRKHSHTHEMKDPTDTFRIKNNSNLNDNGDDSRIKNAKKNKKKLISFHFVLFRIYSFSLPLCGFLDVFRALCLSRWLQYVKSIHGIKIPEFENRMH